MSGHRRILLLTEDAALAALLPPRLAQEAGSGTRFEAEATSPVQGHARLAEAAGRIDATLLDAAASPGPAHWGPLLREAGGGRPVLLLGGDLALPEGITERVAKPVRVPDLLARLHALLAVFEASPQAAITLPGYAFHPAAKLLQAADGARVRLTEKEAAILLYLHRAGGRAVPRTELLGEVWGYSSAVTTHTLETHVYRLRRKIEADPQEARLLLTDEGGYRLGV
ncbi:winged helix-turn-helix domain-containing protein [Sediminicoccus sp. KRV36]|uniref:winged helix-turn-helix domain-containing protein n=1 Tax=Sediminicoccus sp. KRV36 TaxID=3133721 RepID=UPI00200F7DA2|nr:winged helix-turn-helix domain-containing protein [Sediminicoccus rosea]UPY36634.1 winged helix-turn-helix domain-containing protein [Sediminicoccus rosea]